MLFFRVVFVVEGKSGKDYRKRSKPQECARVERKVEGAER